MSVGSLTNNQLLGLSAAIATGLMCYVLMKKYKKSKRNWRPVSTVVKLYVYPIKSCQGVSVDAIQCERHGIVNNDRGIKDRTLILCYTNGQMITARQEPKLVLVKPEFRNNSVLCLSAPSMDDIEVDVSGNNNPIRKVRVWAYNGQGQDCGDKVAKWFQDYLNSEQEIRLLYHNSDGHAFKKPDLKSFSHLGVYAEDSIYSTFQDFSPVNILSTSSINDLNKRLDNPVTERAFRPNIYIDGCSPYEEDSWKYVRIGSTEMQFVKNCTRCIFTTIDPDTGVKDADQEPLRTLKSYRNTTIAEEKKLYKSSPKFSDDFVPIKPGEICVGDIVYASD